VVTLLKLFSVARQKPFRVLKFEKSSHKLYVSYKNSTPYSCNSEISQTRVCLLL